MIVHKRVLSSQCKRASNSWICFGFFFLSSQTMHIGTVVCLLNRALFISFRMTLAYNLNYNWTYKSIDVWADANSAEKMPNNGTHSPWICCCVCVCVYFSCVSLNASRYDFFADFGRLFFRCTPFTNVDSVVILSFSFFLFFFTSSLILSIKEADKSVLFLFFSGIFSFEFMHWINQYNRCFAVFNSLEMNTINWKLFFATKFCFSFFIYLYFFLTKCFDSKLNSDHDRSCWSYLST